MIAFRPKTSQVILLSGLLLAKLASAQTVVLAPEDSSTTSEHSQAQALLTANLSSGMEALSEDIRRQQQLLDQAEQRLVDKGATDLQLVSWEEKHVSEFDALDAKNDLLSAYFSFLPLPYLNEVDLPADASMTMKAFIVAAATLHNDRVEIHNELVQNSSEPISVESALDLDDTETDIFFEENAAALHDQVLRAKSLGDEAAHQPWDIPPPLILPPGTSSQLAALLTVKDQIARGQVQVHNTYCAGRLSQLNAATEQWQEQNAYLFQRVRQLTLALAQSTAQQE